MDLVLRLHVYVRRNSAIFPKGTALYLEEEDEDQVFVMSAVQSLTTEHPRMFDYCVNKKNVQVSCNAKTEFQRLLSPIYSDTTQLNWTSN